MTDILENAHNLQDIWSKVLEEIGKNISKPSFDTWITHLISHIEDDLIIITAQNDFVKDWVDERYRMLILEKIREVAGRAYDIKIVSSGTVNEVIKYTTTSRVNGLSHSQALGYFLLACKDDNLSEETIKNIYKNMKWHFDIVTPEEAEEEGYKWFRSLINS